MRTVIKIINKTYKLMIHLLPTKNNVIKRHDKKVNTKFSNQSLKKIMGTDLSNVRNIRYFKEIQLSYNAIPKNGHTNIMIIFNEILENNKSNIKAIRRYGRLSKDMFSLDTHYDIFQSYKFTFVRNPFIRALSMYKYMFEHRHKNVDCRSGFIEFLKFLKYGGINLNAHFMPQTDLLFFEVNALDFIGKLEQFEEDFNNLLQEIKIKPSDKVLSLIKNRINTDHVTLSENYLEDYYTEESIQLVQEIFKIDFDNFRYSYDFDRV